MFQCKLLKMKFNIGSVCASHTLDPCMPTDAAQPGCVMKVSRDHRLLRGKDNLVPAPTPPTSPGCSRPLFPQDSRLSQGHKSLHPCPLYNLCVIILVVLLHQGPFSDPWAPFGRSPSVAYQAWGETKSRIVINWKHLQLCPTSLADFQYYCHI